MWWAVRPAWACEAVSLVANVLLVGLGLSPGIFRRCPRHTPALPACAPRQQNSANTSPSHALGGRGEATGLERPRWTGHALQAAPTTRSLTEHLQGWALF